MSERKRPSPPSSFRRGSLPVVALPRCRDLSTPPPPQQQQQQHKHRCEHLPGFSINSHTSNERSYNVQPPPLPTRKLAPQHRPLAKATPALALAGTTRAIDSKYGRSGEFDEDDGGSSAGYARIGWILRCDVHGSFEGPGRRDGQGRG